MEAVTAQWRPIPDTPSHANHIRTRLDHVPRPGFDADVYVVLDNFERFFFGKVAHV
jgi:hypothetical protein